MTSALGPAWTPSEGSISVEITFSAPKDLKWVFAFSAISGASPWVSPTRNGPPGNFNETNFTSFSALFLESLLSTILF